MSYYTYKQHLITFSNDFKNEKALQILKKFNIDTSNLKEKYSYIYFSITDLNNGFIKANPKLVKPKDLYIESYQSHFDLPRNSFGKRRNINDFTKINNEKDLNRYLKLLFRDYREPYERLQGKIEDLLNENKNKWGNIKISNHFTMTYPSFLSGTEVIIPKSITEEIQKDINKQLNELFDKFEKKIEIYYEDDDKPTKFKKCLNNFDNDNSVNYSFGLAKKDTIGKENNIYDFLKRIA